MSPMAGEIGVTPCLVITLVSSRSVSSTPSISAAEAARLSSGIACNRAVQVVVDRQKIAGQPRPAVLLGLAPVTVGALAAVLGIRQRPHELVAQLVAFGPQRLNLGGLRIAVEKFFQIRKVSTAVCCLVLCHSSVPCLQPAPAVRQQAAHQLGGVIDDGHDAAIVQPGRTDDTRPHR
jgi:hypothetical protein